MTKFINNPNGAYGYADLQTQGPQTIYDMKTSAAIVAPAVIAVGTTGLISAALTNGTVSLALGICISSAASGDTVPVVVHGVVENVPVDGATAAGSFLKPSVTTAGRLAATATPAAGEIVAIALAASVTNTTDVWVLPSKVTT